MFKTQNLRTVSLTVIALALVVAFASPTFAVSVSYNIDPARSVLYVNMDPTVTAANPTGDVTKLLATPVVAQSAGSDTDYYTGTILADNTAGLLTFTGGSSIIAALNPNGLTPFLPVAFPGTDNYGIKTATATSTTGAVVFATLRDTALDITTGTLTNGTAPVGMNLQVAATSYASVTLFGQAGTGGAGLNSTGALASLTTSGGIETLIIPITRITGTSAHFVLMGQLVATRQVPEPSTVVMGVMGAMGLGLAVLRKRNKRTA